MRLTDIDPDEVRRAVRREGRPTFRTKDIAAAVRSRHALVAEEGSYNSMIGRYLSKHRTDLGIELADPGHGNAVWRRR